MPALRLWVLDSRWQHLTSTDVLGVAGTQWAPAQWIVSRLSTVHVGELRTPVVGCLRGDLPYRCVSERQFRALDRQSPRRGAFSARLSVQLTRWRLNRVLKSPTKVVCWGLEFLLPSSEFHEPEEARPAPLHSSRCLAGERAGWP